MSTPSFKAPAEGAAASALAPTMTYPPAVQRHIDELSELPEGDYRDALADAVFQEDPEELAAFHSDVLVERTYFAAMHLVKNANNTLYRRGAESDREYKARVTTFRDAMGIERRRAQALVENLRMRQGRPTAAPNARSRAARELQRRHAVEYLELVRKHEEEIRAEEADRRAKRKAERRAARR